MPASGLTPKRVETAQPKRRHYAIRDRKVKGLGLLVAPSGRKTFVIDKVVHGDRHKETIGEVNGLTLKEAREAAEQRIGEIAALYSAGPDTPFEVIAELTMRRMERLWKPGTMETNRSYLRAGILPFFKGRAIASITRADVQDWIAGMRSKPAAANRSAPILSTIMRVAEDVEARPEDSNPVKGIRLYRNNKKERVLTPHEMARLGAALEESSAGFPLHSSLIRLLVLTGCRLGELRNLHWRDYRDGRLHLPDSKTGPKTVFLSSHARAVLDGIGTSRKGLVFPSGRKRGVGISVKKFWEELRREVGIEDVRLHDLRHHYATTAIRSGESLTVIGLLLGHQDPCTTLRYAHLDDAMMRDAVKVVGEHMARKGDGQ